MTHLCKLLLPDNFPRRTEVVAPALEIGNVLIQQETSTTAKIMETSFPLQAAYILFLDDSHSDDAKRAGRLQLVEFHVDNVLGVAFQVNVSKCDTEPAREYFPALRGICYVRFCLCSM